MNTNTLKGISDEEFKRLLLDDPDFVQTLLKQQGYNEPTIIKTTSQKPKNIIHRTSDPNGGNADPNDPNNEKCTDPNCKLCEKPNNDPKSEPNNNSNNNELSEDWLKRIAKIIPKYKNMAYVYDWYIAGDKDVDINKVKDNVIYYEGLK